MYLTPKWERLNRATPAALALSAPDDATIYAGNFLLVILGETRAEVALTRSEAEAVAVWILAELRRTAPTKGR